MKRFDPQLKTSIYDVCAYSLMIGLGESYIAAYAIALGLKETSAGLATVIPVVIGALLQLWAPLGIRMLGSRQLWVSVCATGQALSLLLLASLPYWHASLVVNEILLYLFASLYWTASLSASPAWTSWISSLVKVEERIAFFSTRTHYAQLFTLLGLAIGGTSLHFYPPEQRLQCFSVLLVAAALCRMTSGALIFYQQPRIKAAPQLLLKLGRIPNPIKAISSTAGLPMVWFLLCTHFAVNVSGPYFNPYMLEQLEFSFAMYMFSLASVFIGRILGARFFDHMQSRWGIRALLVIGALSIIPIPVLWSLSPHYLYILTLQLWAGFAWGAHELGFTLVLLEQLDENQRGRLLTIANLMNSLAMGFGSLVGAQLLSGSPSIQTYTMIFAVSSLLRLLPLLFLPAAIQRPIAKVRPRLFRIVAVRLSGFPLQKPLPEGEPIYGSDKAPEEQERCQ